MSESVSRPHYAPLVVKGIMDSSTTPLLLPDGGLLQSAGWAAVLLSEGHQSVVRSGAGFSYLYEVRSSPFGNYLYIPRGPSRMQPEAIAYCVADILDQAARHHALYVRIEPSTDTALRALRGAFGYSVVESLYSVQPKLIGVLPLSGTIEEVQKSFHEKTRYNTRLAERKGVICEAGSMGDLPEFYRLLQATGGRKSLRLHPIEHYRAILENLPGACLRLARYQGAILAAYLMVYPGPHGTTAYYLHGGTSSSERSVMAPHALMTHCIAEALTLGASAFDFGGMSSDPESPWAGITRFKRGFGATEVALPGTYDVVLQSVRYQLYRTALSVRLRLR